MRTGRIVKIEGEVITIGMDDGTIKEVRRCDIGFEPSVGDRVEVYESEDMVMVMEESDKPNDQNPNGAGININMTNSINNTAETAAGSGKKVVNKLVYCLLAFFVGGLGIHKFYSGKIGMGILYIVFCWTMIPSLVAFVEMIIAITKKADANGNIVV